MSIALVTSHGRMAACFAGVDILIAEDGKGIDYESVLSTHGWHPLVWGRQLAGRNVESLLCSGIDHGTWSAMQGHGIQVIPGVMGEPEAVLQAWLQGKMRPPAAWPVCPGMRGRGRGRRRFRGGWY